MKRKTKIVGLFLMIAVLFFAIPGFGKVQASREDDVFDVLRFFGEKKVSFSSMNCRWRAISGR